MLQIESTACRSWAYRLSAYNQSAVFEHSDLVSNHNQIMIRLCSIINELNTTAYNAEMTESSLQSRALSNASRASITSAMAASVQKNVNSFSASLQNTNATNLKKNSAKLPGAKLSLDAAYMTASATQSLGSLGTNTVSGSLMALDVDASCSVWVFDEKGKTDPGVSAKADASLSLAQIQDSLNMSFGIASLSGTSTAKAGTAYAHVEVTADKKGFVAEGAVGAAALKAETAWSFTIGSTVFTISGSASLLSAEASFTGKITSDEISFGSSAGLGVGLGWNVSIKKNKDTVLEKGNTSASQNNEAASAKAS